ncbi:hypothetical protein IWQ62_004109 [Dispira parvispora]|uniref:Uncharacterized protein n=1 Tax=Dispira parvispora TaxID=1520584 RepID=A0A9W8E0Z9_9FUNG|nr:hypothetical protein IWQ62_004109 [Dispira parvispora]
MTVRNILDDGSPSASKDDGMAWAEVWDEYQKNNGNPAEDDTEKSETKMSTASTPDHQGIKSIVYGHDAGRGLKVRKYAYGLDSGCVYGKSLTALVLPGWEIYRMD